MTVEVSQSLDAPTAVGNEQSSSTTATVQHSQSNLDSVVLDEKSNLLTVKSSLVHHPNDNPALDDEAEIRKDELIERNKHQIPVNRTPSFLPQTALSDDSAVEAIGLVLDDNHQNYGNNDDHNHDDDGDTDKHDATTSSQQGLHVIADATGGSTPLASSASASASVSSDFPSRSILKASIDEDIPIKTKKSFWGKLPAPDMQHVKMKRIESLNSIASSHPSSPDLIALNDPLNKSSSTLDTAAANTNALKKSDSKVSFQHIIVREYQQTIGDNPSVGYGTPITLDWDYSENEPLDLDLYECTRGGRRTMRQMYLNHYQRKNIFVHQLGFTEAEVKAAKRATNKVRSQREFSKMMQTTLQPLLVLEEMRESAMRKIQRRRQQQRR